MQDAHDIDLRLVGSPTGLLERLRRAAELDLHVDGALALGFLVIKQVSALHEHGMAHNNISPGALLFNGSMLLHLARPTIGQRNLSRESSTA